LNPASSAVGTPGVSSERSPDATTSAAIFPDLIFDISTVEYKLVPALQIYAEIIAHLQVRDTGIKPK